MVTGGEDGYLCTWPCNAVEQGDDIEVDDVKEEENSTDDEMDIDSTLSSPKSKKRDRNQNAERVCPPRPSLSTVQVSHELGHF